MSEKKEKKTRSKTVKKEKTETAVRAEEKKTDTKELKDPKRSKLKKHHSYSNLVKKISLKLLSQKRKVWSRFSRLNVQADEMLR